MSIKLSQISSGGAVAPTTDQLVAVRSGSSDVLVTPGQAAAKAVSNNANPTVASVDTNAIALNHVAQFADTAGTIKDGGALGTSAAQAASSVTGTVAAVNGGTTIGHIATFIDAAGTIHDGGAPYSLPVATTSTLGGVIIDGTTITIAAGVISAVSSSQAYVAGNGVALASGLNSSALGTGAQATATATVAIGHTSAASGANSMAIGDNARATGDRSISIGKGLSGGLTGTGADAIVIGNGSSLASQVESIAIGPGASTTAICGIAIGSGVSVSGADAIAISGNESGSASVSGSHSVGIGFNVSDGNFASAVCLGDSRVAAAANEIRIGNPTYEISVRSGGAFYAPAGDGFLHHTIGALADGAGAQAATLTNGPAAGNPTKWIKIDDNGTTRYIPAW